MEQIKIYLFGKFSVEINGKLINKIEPRKAEELLAYLLLNRDRPHTRERLADILWGRDLSGSGKQLFAKNSMATSNFFR